MRIIADSGSTKTDWVCINKNKKPVFITTEGINPLLLDDTSIKNIFDFFLNEIDNKTPVESIAFYGAGVRNEQASRLKNIFIQHLNNNNLINNEIDCIFESDLLCAARALFQQRKGIACILGTGSNSCIYDGENIFDNIPAMGYILGDEGGGAKLGIRFVNALYKRQLPEQLKNDFEREYNLSLDKIIENVYRQSMPNRFLATFAKFIFSKIHIEEINTLVKNHFLDFIKLNIEPYNSQNLPVGFVGSIAYYFQDQLTEAAKIRQIKIDKIIKSPINGIIKYHFPNDF